MYLSSERWGRVLVLDEAIQLAEFDEFVWQETASFVALNSHPDPKKAKGPRSFQEVPAVHVQGLRQRQIPAALWRRFSNTNFREPLYKFSHETLKEFELKYYTPDVHRAVFALPFKMAEMLPSSLPEVLVQFLRCRISLDSSFHKAQTVVGEVHPLRSASPPDLRLNRDCRVSRAVDRFALQTFLVTANRSHSVRQAKASVPPPTLDQVGGGEYCVQVEWI
ncbi:unnamed protein product [Larinioides sclopetarius]|uniref:PABS domain-containing protein n=1 Tax=Larinioides sclopetarius TaxID=280406 RepID=A0AAV2BFG3_9ARAC